MKMIQMGLLNQIQRSHWDFVQNQTANFSLHRITRKFKLIYQIILNQSFGVMKIYPLGGRDCVIFLFTDHYWRKQELFLSQLLQLMVTNIVSKKTDSLS